MRKVFAVLTTAIAFAAVSSLAAPNFPFPQNMKHPHGNIIEYADVNMIMDHYNKWKNTWYDANQGWILAPEGTCSTTSEAIAYGMLIAVYMDNGQNGAKDMFDKLYETWKANGGNGAGMNWRFGCDGGTGSASDADFDAALALIMASKQWDNDSYLNDAKALLDWIFTNDIDGTKIKSGNERNYAFNPSYATLANFRVFDALGGSHDWNGVATWAASEIKACQNQSTGLVPDWCTWDSHQPTRPDSSVQLNYIGFFDEAVRTPWRIAWDYYWFGTASSKNFNATITKWLYVEAPVASDINSGYYVEGKAEKSVNRHFISSTFSGGLGLAASSDDSEVGVNFLGSVYNYLASKTACANAEECGTDSNPGEKYYSSTLNLLYLLLLTGNMPNFYDTTGFTAFTPDPNKAPNLSEFEGQRMEIRDTTVGISGFWYWGAYHDRYGLGTEMNPDSGLSPLIVRGGKIYAEASMKIGPDPEWSQEAEDAGTLLYPNACIAMNFFSDRNKGVDLEALGVAKLRIDIKTSGPIRMAVLNGLSVEAFSEPGVYVANSSDYKVFEYDLTPENYGFKGFSEKNDFGGLLDWVNLISAPDGKDIIKNVRGLRFEIRQKEGGFGDVSIRAVEFLDSSGTVIDPVLITGMSGVRSEIVEEKSSSSGNLTNPSSSSNPVDIGSSPSSAGNALPTVFAPATFNVSVNGLQIKISNAAVGSNLTVFSMLGMVVQTGMVKNNSELVTVKNKGVYLVRVGNEIRSVIVK